MALSLKQVEKKKKKINQKSLQMNPNTMDTQRSADSDIEIQDKEIQIDKSHEILKPWSKELKTPKSQPKNPIDKNLNKPTSLPFKLRIPVPRFFHQKSK